MRDQLILIGIIVVFIGFLLIITGSILTAMKSKTKTEWAVGGILWFIPFGFGTKESLIKLSILISAIFLFLLILLNLMGR